MSAAPLAAAPLAWSTRHLLDDSAEELTAIAAWGDQRVLVGTASGSLLHFAPATDSGLPSLRERKRAHTHSIVQLAVAMDFDALIMLLASGTVAHHALGTLEQRDPVPDAIDCTHMALRAEGTFAQLAAASKKKKVMLYAWRATDGATPGGGSELSGGTFERTAEVALAEPLRFMTWGGEDQLWLALRQRYVRLTASQAPPALEELLPAAKGAEPIGVPLLPATHGAAAEVLLLSQDTLGVVLGVDAKPSREVKRKLSRKKSEELYPGVFEALRSQSRAVRDATKKIIDAGKVDDETERTFQQLKHNSTTTRCITSS